MPPPLNIIDMLALAWFLLCWTGYTWLANYRSKTTRSLMRVTHCYREIWMRRLLERENRIVDSTLLGNLMRSVAFFASTTIIIIGGLIAMLGASDKVIGIITELPFAVPTVREAWEFKLLLLIMIFIYAFFKFTWSLRQFNYCNILIGAAPLAFNQLEDRDACARQIAGLNSLAGNNFNYGLRAYYFGLAVLTWFINPWLFMGVSGWVVAVLYRREFASKTLKALMQSEILIGEQDQHLD